MIRVLLIAGLAATAYLVFLRRNKLPVHIMLVFALLAAGVAAVMFPESTNDIAHAVGVGRGADLVSYLFEVTTFFVLLHYYTKFVELQRQITTLTRELAIARAEQDPRATDRPTP